MINDEFYMSLAIKKAWEFQILTYPNPAVGCVILDAGGRLLSVAAHKRAGFLHAEPSAVLLALCQKCEAFLSDFLREYNAAFGVKFKNAAELENADLQPNFTYEYILQNHGDLLKGAKAYVTLEPCAHRGKTPPCAELLRRLKFAEVVIARGDENVVASGGAHILQSGAAVKFDVLKQDADELIEPFLAWQRGNFSFFKLALSANGVAVGTTQSKIISNLASRTHSHRLRSAAELLVIGGATVRADRPRLDTRLIKGGKNPNVMICSREREFDAS
ncbi:bifunctional diaminohydroxyphosphoribosylaminopyrimidine deaminase/5-amino-6-(5-phosphoribosylamino)uracil reductase RibD, partial [Campylobacter rectus]|uniref:bifunctional diaminohydroxyphosphoribosylaminopyrimidine deaminase/5-amino-6-(5-phosphoribosylamino)uracil reductase RibD n=1 Tax=Campylobacter rectus TaxID=203 RepID=UPI0028EA2973